VILVDTSAWVEFDRGTGSAVDERLRTVMRAGEVAVCDPVLMEVLAGARDERRAHELRQLLTSFRWLPVQPVADFEGAARVYRSCRRAGITPRGLTDCMIVSMALRSEASLLAADDDFARMAEVLPLRLDRTG
jgi:predicted nucleic acid-binding protein